MEDVRRQVNEAVQARHVGFHCSIIIYPKELPNSHWRFLHCVVKPMQKIDKMYAAFTGQPIEKVQEHTERDRFFAVSEVYAQSDIQRLTTSVSLQ